MEQGEWRGRREVMQTGDGLQVSDKVDNDDEADDRGAGNSTRAGRDQGSKRHM